MPPLDVTCRLNNEDGLLSHRCRQGYFCRNGQWERALCGPVALPSFDASLKTFLVYGIFFLHYFYLYSKTTELGLFDSFSAHHSLSASLSPSSFAQFYHYIRESHDIDE